MACVASGLCVPLLILDSDEGAPVPVAVGADARAGPSKSAAAPSDRLIVGSHELTVTSVCVVVGIGQL
jgi:hypothetical protein